MSTIRLALAQLNFIVGDVRANTQRILDTLDDARAQKVDIVIFPELATSGYPPEDLLLKTDFIAANARALEEICGATTDLVAVVGYPAADDYDLYNAAAVLQNGKVVGTYRKHYLPNYGVFDENRYFGRGQASPVFQFGNERVGVSVCEDIWYAGGPPQWQALHGAELLVNVSASPYSIGKPRDRERMMVTRAVDYVAIVAYCNLVGGQDELVFDGCSLVVGPDGQILARGPAFEEALLVVDVDTGAVFRRRLHDPRSRQNRTLVGRLREAGESIPMIPSQEPLRIDSTRPSIRPPLEAFPARLEEVWRALVLGTRDYVRKNGFETVLLGLSGGIDSAVSATIAVDALGADHVVGVSMPSRYSSQHSQDDAAQLAQNLGIRYLRIPIEAPFTAILDTLNGPPDHPFAHTSFNVAEENIQARLRGLILMALSNKFGWLLLSTGNKSENAVGYATLYGDMAGGFALIKDVPKTLVWELARWRNQQSESEVIPPNSITKPPSAELRPDQLDSDSLPPYDILDTILQLYIEEDHGFHEIVAAGFDENLVRRVIRMVDRNEYKRRQAAPGIKITGRAFGKDRRLPITNHYNVNSRE
ncbi:MAG: NAD+ synthase [Chloroflexi bacterium]|nr:NAD+ synthase [Chloroflexota bacterium]